jgi:biopolymer transport protein ExbD
MRIRIKPSRRRQDKVTLNMASMIDATFLLLSYFLVTTAMSKPEDRLSPMLQTQSREAGQASDFQPQRLEVAAIDGQPSYQLATRVLRSREELHDALTPLPKDAGLFVLVHRGVDVGFAVSAMQVAHDVGFTKVTYVPAKQ